MRTLKKLALMSVLAVGALAASASAASAVTAYGGAGGVSFTTGGTQLNHSVLSVSCASATAAGTIANGGNVSNVPITLTFANCEGPGGPATVTCGAGFLLTLSGSSQPFTASIAVPVYQASPLRGCRINTATGCEIRVRANSGNTTISGTARDNGTGVPATLITNATSLNFTTSGGFPCLFVSSGSAVFEAAPGGGAITWSETAGSDVTLNP